MLVDRVISLTNYKAVSVELNPVGFSLVDSRGSCYQSGVGEALHQGFVQLAVAETLEDDTDPRTNCLLTAAICCRGLLRCGMVLETLVEWDAQGFAHEEIHPFGGAAKVVGRILAGEELRPGGDVSFHEQRVGL